MIGLNEKATYSAGPYKGYYGHADYDHHADLFHGEVIGTRDVITFQGRSIDEVRKAFRDSIDDYLQFCRQRGESPDKPFSGKFLVRVSPQLHKQISVLAERAGTSLNAMIADCLKRIAEGDPAVAAKPAKSPKGKRSEKVP
jgi:predicted HicB family RNase H-like nuclease